MTGSPSFSIVIPAYNYGHCLARCVASAMAQDVTDYDVLVVDDGSTDETEQVMSRLLAKYGSGRLRYLKQENRGPAAVRSRGVRETSGQWLLFLDADDELYSSALTVFRDAILASPDAGIVLAGHDSVSSDGVRSVSPGRLALSRKANFSGYLRKRISFSNGASVIARRVAETLDFREELRHTEDIPVFAHLLACYDAVSVDVPVLRVHKHKDSRRHDHAAALALGMKLVDIVFDDNGLPDWALAFRKEYAVRRALSLMRMADQAGLSKDLVVYWKILVKLDWSQMFRPRPVRLLLRNLLRR